MMNVVASLSRIRNAFLQVTCRGVAERILQFARHQKDWSEFRVTAEGIMANSGDCWGGRVIAHRLLDAGWLEFKISPSVSLNGLYHFICTGYTDCDDIVPVFRIANRQEIRKFAHTRKMTVLQSPWINVHLQDVQTPLGMTYTKVICHSPPVVSVLPQRDDGRCILTQFFRPVINRESWELISGNVETDESPDEAARRELAEEIGLRNPILTLLIPAFFPSNGISTQMYSIWLAQHFTQGETRHDPEEDIRKVRAFSYPEMIHMICNGEISDAPTAQAITIAALHNGMSSR